MTAPTPGNTDPAPLVWDALSRVLDPEIRRPITELGMVRAVTVNDSGDARVSILLTIAGCPAADRIERDTREAVTGVAGIRTVSIEIDVMDAEQRSAFVERVRSTRPQRQQQFGPDSLTRVIAVTSGKGGVGKSSITANLALAMTRLGFSVGIIDADVFGFSIPGILGLNEDVKPTKVGDLILPPEAFGVKVISIGMFLAEGERKHTAVAWRGPMLHRTLEQFLNDVWFGDLDVLFLDMPPGTGDVALSLGQLLPHAEVLVITTPQPAAADVAVRSGLLAHKAGQHILGVVENMSGLVQPDGAVLELFGAGGGETVAETLRTELNTSADSAVEVPLLAKIPLSVEFRIGGDTGEPTSYHNASEPAAAAITALADVVRDLGPRLEQKRLPLHLN